MENHQHLRHPEKTDILHRPLVHILLITGLALLAYSNTFQVPFILDDIKEIAENPIIKNLDYFRDPASARGLFSFHSLKMRTVGYFTLAMNYKFGGTDVVGYHVFNLAIHLLNSLLVYVLLRLTFRAPFFQSLIPGQGSNAQDQPGHACYPQPLSFIPLFTALIFAVHPIQTEAVTYVVQRLTSLTAFFCLLSLTSYSVARLGTGKTGHGKTLAWFLLSFLSAVAAMKTKEIAFTLPVVIALYEFLFLREKFRRRLLFLAPSLLTMLIIPLSLIGTSKPVGEMLSSASLVSRVDQTVSRGDYLFTQFRVIVSYLRLLLFPVGQNLDHDYPTHPDFFTPEVFLSFLFLSSLFAFAVFCVWASRFPDHGSRVTDHRFSSPELRLIGFGILWFFIALSVESSIIPINDVMVEHRLYFPSVGFFLALVAAASGLARRFKADRPGVGRAATATGTVIVVALAGATFTRNLVWQDNLKMWQDVIAKSPQNPRGYNNIGIYYDQRGDYEKAIPYFQQAIAVEPDYDEALFNLGIAHAALKQTDQAIYYYQKALALRPTDPKILFNLGVSYMSKKLMGPAAIAFQEALRLDPKMTQARMFLDYARSQLRKK